MEPAAIDWKNLEWRFVRDDLYEHFNAPKWIDLSAPSPRGGSSSSVPSDEAWFCRPDCRHPKTADDFLGSRSSPPSGQSKAELARAWSSPLGERNQTSSNSNNSTHRDAKLKRRGGALPPSRDSPKSKLPGVKKKFREDLENQGPNLSPGTPRRVAKVAKETIKSSAEQREPPLMPERPLKSTLSARNLFAGKDILTQISEFCHEIKRLAMPRSESSRGGGNGDSGEEDKNKKAKKDLNALEEKGEKALLIPGEDAENTKKKKQGRDAGKEGLENPRMVPEPKKTARENSPLLQGLENLKVPPEPKKKARKNLPSLQGLEKLKVPPEPKKKARENSPLLQEVRSCPPTPQRFPSPITLRRKATITPVKSSLKPGPPERGILRELVHNKKEEEQALVGMDGGSIDNIISNSPASAEGKSVDLFWFFKPCTYLGGR